MKEFESNPTIEDLQKDVPFIVYEGTQARNERTVKRLITALILFILLTFLSNIGWLIYEAQFKTISYEQDGKGLNNINTGSQGDVDYGAESKDSGKSSCETESD